MKSEHEASLFQTLSTTILKKKEIFCKSKASYTISFRKATCISLLCSGSNSTKRNFKYWSRDYSVYLTYNVPSMYTNCVLIEHLQVLFLASLFSLSRNYFRSLAELLSYVFVFASSRTITEYFGHVFNLMPGIDLASLRGTKYFAYPHVDAAWKWKKKSSNETVLLEGQNKSATNCVKRACTEAVKENFF